MRFFLLALIPFLASCHSLKKSEETTLLTTINGSSLKYARLTDDDILILEVHYPKVLQKILIQHSLGVREVLTLHGIGLEADILIHLIKYTGSIFMLTADDVVKLQLEGVPLQVINLMIES